MVVGLSGGLGNQLFQYAAGRALSLRLNVPLELDVSWFSGRTDRNYALQPFKINGAIRKRHVWLPNFLIRTESRISRRFALNRMTVPIYREPHFHFDAGFEKLQHPVFLEGYWQSPRYFEKYVDFIRSDLTLAEPLPAQCQSMLMEIQKSDAICLHIRRGDYVSNRRVAGTHSSCSLDYYWEAVMHVMSGLFRPKCFLFSDDHVWVRNNINLPCEFVVVDINTSGEAYRDLVLMSECRHFVIANSSLSWWAAWLGSYCGKRVVAPSNWFKDKRKNTKDLIPAEWEQL
ncbi:alpha-1,2-fucosyltransferase [Methylophaga sp.]|uniref:alpha-1,2-fucosyltransferase n=1 Tax=Methylophaga sp. TaxID=2024840 RepID=UPI003A8DE9DD